MSTGILNTEIGYVEDYTLPNKNIWNQEAMGFLAGQEQKLYNLLGRSDLQGFMEEIHRMLDQAGNIRDILANFKKSNLVTTFDLPQVMPLINQEIHLSFVDAPEISFKELFGPLAMVPGLQIDIPNSKLTFVYNEATIKTLMNYLENRTGSRAFRITGGSGFTRVNKAFKEWLAKNKQNLFQMKINGNPTDINMVSQTSNKASNLFGFTQKDILKAINEDITLRRAIIDTRHEVYNELFKLCEGSEDLQKAFREVWTRKMGSITSVAPETLMKFMFLSKGGNLNAGVSGAIQEMYGALLTEYLGLLKQKSLPKGLVEIMGNIVEGGEQPKADLMILNEIGIQVKAYGMNNKIKHMESNLHPNALDAQLNPYGAVNVGDAIVQSVFNTDNESPTSIASNLRAYGAALLNLATSKDLGVKNTVCFYLIDAQYLVPGSEIVRVFAEKPTDYEVKITSSFNGRSSNEYKELYYLATNAYHYKNRPTVRLSPGYIEYFDKEGNEEIHADENNKKQYESLYTSRISIRTIFDYGFANNQIYNLLGH